MQERRFYEHAPFCVYAQPCNDVDKVHETGEIHDTLKVAKDDTKRAAPASPKVKPILYKKVHKRSGPKAMNIH